MHLKYKMRQRDRSYNSDESNKYAEHCTNIYDYIRFTCVLQQLYSRWHQCVERLPHDCQRQRKSNGLSSRF